VRAPDALASYIAHKGSICIDGTSLTVNAVDGARFDLNIIPQTMAETVFGDYRPGTRVNLEVDVIARYLERLLQGDAARRGRGPASEPGNAGGKRIPEARERGRERADGQPVGELLDDIRHGRMVVLLDERDGRATRAW
jgi:hypothetical protein